MSKGRYPANKQRLRKRLKNKKNEKFWSQHFSTKLQLNQMIMNDYQLAPYDHLGAHIGEKDEFVIG